MQRKGWSPAEEKLLISNYKIKTISELIELFAKMGKQRNGESINAKIKRLKAKGRIDGYKNEDTVVRSLKQRRI